MKRGRKTAEPTGEANGKARPDARTTMMAADASVEGPADGFGQPVPETPPPASAESYGAPAAPVGLAWEPLAAPPIPPTDDAFAGVAMVDSAYAYTTSFNAYPDAAYPEAGYPDGSAVAGDAFIGGLDGWPTVPAVAAEEPGWSASLRLWGRIGVWALPVSAIGIAMSALWGWPQPGVASSGPGTWLVVTLAGITLGLLGSLAVAALVSPTPGRNWAVASAVLMIAGAVTFAPMLGVVGLARPAITNAAARISKQAPELNGSFVDGQVARWLTVIGLALLAVGLASLAVAVVASQLLTRVDGYLILAAVAIAILAAWLGWQFLLVIAAMTLLAAGLGLAFTASRITSDGRVPG